MEIFLADSFERRLRKLGRRYRLIADDVERLVDHLQEGQLRCRLLIELGLN